MGVGAGVGMGADAVADADGFVESQKDSVAKVEAAVLTECIGTFADRLGAMIEEIQEKLKNLASNDRHDSDYPTALHEALAALEVLREIDG